MKYFPTKISPYMVSLSLHIPGYGHQSSQSLSPEERVVGLALSQPAAKRGAHRCSGDSSATGEIPSLVRFVTTNFESSLEIFSFELVQL